MNPTSTQLPVNNNPPVEEPPASSLQAESRSDHEDRVFGTLLIGDERHKIMKGAQKIGRDPKCEIFINSLTVSRVHAVIDAEEDGITVQDEGSSNGTKKDHMSLKPGGRYILINGEQLTLGNVVAKFSVEDQDQVEGEDQEGGGAKKRKIEWDLTLSLTH